MRTNTQSLGAQSAVTHEGARVRHLKPIDELRRTVMACMLWESTFYESGESAVQRIKGLVPKCAPHDVAELAIEAREKMRLRHVPLALVRELARTPSRCPDHLIANTLARVIQRADELAEFLSMYWAEGRKPLANQVKRGLARAFEKFNEYQLAKYNRDYAVKLRDVMRLVRPKPSTPEQAALWGRLIKGELATPDTWEVALSSGANRVETWERLIATGKLGYMALLRNLRNMHKDGVLGVLVHSALVMGAKNAKALPFRYVAAARAVPAWESYIDDAMKLSLAAMDRLPGRTCVLVDVSGSMNDLLSAKSDLTRRDAAAALAILLRGICDEVRVFRFTNHAQEVPARFGMALADAIGPANGGTEIGQAVREVRGAFPNMDRLIVITDEQSRDPIGAPGCKGYIINVASYQNGVGYGPWTTINGFSEAVVSYIAQSEQVR